ncbi:TetR/AcrR family transcriptional regulator C-terminal domain-containing protein [Solirubrobacter sp. CPCC 204708]|uniref:TetR/AcrR family transcriptional regulator C-terminal domain-containing protein n=1 Tax=Solirubrobacter deserti TaxID=2282478 RepID=A0ABT4RBM2_9ACTN|nr:TetR/AcrR family transcriptional regulator C-terminal domain-containing protein [Solirubrobacter deserti]MBE2317183.1 TetR/AcrR family transcriptional regulator C-terminal domain-containing protein [Solirubrobacter deserti]MDA0135924.1 TetR/AcrR family transcriptional regulator C-terminal domain-containing protein [Solirubrobacter deserti]
MARPPKPILSRRGIAEEALRLVEEEGIEHLTTRKLAKRLGVEGPSLYNHIANRDDLLDEMHGIVDETVDPSALDHEDWRVGLVEFARSYRRAFSVRPELVAIIASRPVRHTVALRAYDDMFARFARFGWEPRYAATVMAAIDYLVLGSAIETFKGGFDRPAADYEDDFPHLAAALHATEGGDIDDLGFELGLQALIAKVEADTTSG